MPQDGRYSRTHEPSPILIANSIQIAWDYSAIPELRLKSSDTIEILRLAD
jgi:hypothetical protein